MGLERFKRKEVVGKEDPHTNISVLVADLTRERRRKEVEKEMLREIQYCYSNIRSNSDK